MSELYTRCRSRIGGAALLSCRGSRLAATAYGSRGKKMISSAAISSAANRHVDAAILHTLWLRSSRETSAEGQAETSDLSGKTSSPARYHGKSA